MKILIATTNRDKFKLVSYLLSSSIFKDAEFYSLYDIESIPPKRESGNVKKRSLVKAQNIFDNISNNIFDYIIGVDDGLRINGKVITAVKEYTKDILDDHFLKEGQRIELVRAYTFMDKDGNTNTVVTDIPYIYTVCSEYSLEDFSFPLSQVFKPINGDIPLYLMDEKEGFDYALGYSIDALREVSDFYDELYREKC